VKPAFDHIPGAHAVWTSLVGQEYPAVQVVEEVDPAAQNVPAVHAVHVADELAPAVAEYVPAAHVIHADWPVPLVYDPAAHCVRTPPVHA